MDKTSIGNRMKENYENRYRIKLTRRMPVIIRLDGKAFHSLTKRLDKPFDEYFVKGMIRAAEMTAEEIQGAKCIYVQSDEASILLTDFDKLNSDAWFDYNLQKLVSISAAMMSVYFSQWLGNVMKLDNAIFDARAFNIPKEEVVNYFIWRQQDWIRNSVHMLARSVYSHKELHKKNVSDMHEMLYEKGINWADLDPVYKNGAFMYKTINRNDVTYFKRDYEVDFKKPEYRHIIETYLYEIEV